MWFEGSLFYNENIVAALKIENATGVLDRLIVVESDYSFQYRYKGFTWNQQSPLVHYTALDGKTTFIRPRWGLKRHFPFFGLKKPGWLNEAIQRNAVQQQLSRFVRDEDLVILSDIDELVDWRHREYLEDLVRKHQIITIRLHFTVFFLNLFSLNWAGPPDYSYRVFLMTGKYFKSLRRTSDQLRKAGEKGQLCQEIYCPPEILGFHHSWLGDETWIAHKLQDYAHTAEDHIEGLYRRDGSIDLNMLRAHIQAGLSIFPGHKLAVRRDIPMLEAIEKKRDVYSPYFL